MEQEIPTIRVLKQVYGTTRYRFRIGKKDLTQAGLRKFKSGFKVIWSTNMNEKDIAKIEAIWGDKIIKETTHAQ